LKNSQLTCGERQAYFGDRTLARPVVEQIELGFLFLFPARTLMQNLRLRKARLSLGIELRGFQVRQNFFCPINDLSW
jgi:hypothetical protein